MKLKKVKFEGWDNCIELKSGDFKLIKKKNFFDVTHILFLKLF